jgi:hypothetical protein
MIFICPITGDNFDSLVKMVSVRLLQCNFLRGKEENVVDMTRNTLCMGQRRSFALSPRYMTSERKKQKQHQ